MNINGTEIHDVNTTEDPWMPGFYYVDFRVKSKIEASSSNCWITSASVSICDASGCIDGPYDMSSDASVGPDWYTSGVLSIWGILAPGDSITANVEACEECWSSDCVNEESAAVTVPSTGSSAAKMKAASKKKAGKKAARKKTTKQG